MFLVNNVRTCLLNWKNDRWERFWNMSICTENDNVILNFGEMVIKWESHEKDRTSGHCILFLQYGHLLCYYRLHYHGFGPSLKWAIFRVATECLEYYVGFFFQNLSCIYQIYWANIVWQMSNHFLCQAKTWWDVEHVVVLY